jgi:hypothetical protein
VGKESSQVSFFIILFINHIIFLFLSSSPSFYLRPQNAEELFNLRHASARNVIERIFGVCKKRFKIMAHGCQYTIEIQISTVTVMCFIHNFIRSKDPNGLDEEFPQFRDDFIPNPQDSTAPVTQDQDDNLEHFGSTAEGNNRAKNF